VSTKWKPLQKVEHCQQCMKWENSLLRL